MIHTKEENVFLNGPKTHKIQDGGMFTLKFKMAAIFCKIVYVFTDPQMYIFRIHYEFTEIRFFKDICNSMGECAPLKHPTGGLFCHPSKSKWEVPRNNPHHLAKLLHAV